MRVLLMFNFLISLYISSCKITQKEYYEKLDKEGYYNNAMFKLDTYEKNDILLGRDLIVLHETSTMPLNTKIVGKYINEYLE